MQLNVASAKLKGANESATLAKSMKMDKNTWQQSRFFPFHHQKHVSACECALESFTRGSNLAPWVIFVRVYSCQLLVKCLDFTVMCINVDIQNICGNGPEYFVTFWKYIATHYKTETTQKKEENNSVCVSGWVDGCGVE